MARSLPEAQKLEAWAREADYHPGKLAELLGVSEWQLRRAFHDVFDTSPQRWLAQRRLEDAELSLREEGMAKKASHMVGFKEPHNFCRWFKRQRQMTTLEFIARLPPVAPPSAGDESSLSPSI